MPRYTATLFDYLLAQKNQQDALLQQERDKQQSRMDSERSFWADYLGKEADRNIQARALESKSAGALGLPEPSRPDFDPRVEAATHPNYLAGQVDAQKNDEAEQMKLLQLRQQFMLQNEMERGRNERAGDSLGLAKDRAAEAARHDREMAEIARMNAGDRAAQRALMNEIARQRMQDTQDRADASKKVQLGKELAPYEQEHADLNTLLNATAQEGGATGMGPISGRVPDWMMGVASFFGSGTADEAIQNRRAAGNLKRLVSLATGGKNLTENESRQVLASYGIKPGNSDSVIYAGVQALARDAQNAENQIKNSFPKNVVHEYDEGSVTPTIAYSGSAASAQPLSPEQEALLKQARDIYGK